MLTNWYFVGFLYKCMLVFVGVLTECCNFAICNKQT